MLKINLIEGDYYHPRVMRHSGKAIILSPIYHINRDGRDYTSWYSIDIHGGKGFSSYYELKKVNGVIPSVDN